MAETAMGRGLMAVLFGGRSLPGLGAEGAVLVMRIVAGVALALAHGWGKIPPQEGFVEGPVAMMGFPAPTFFAWAAGFSEFFGGLLLAVGLLTRPMALFVILTMSVATYWHFAHSPGMEEGFLEAFKAAENAVLFGAIALMLLVTGSGRLSVDGFLRRS